MKNSSPALYLYFISGILFFLTIILNLETITMFIKPIIVPSILFYYLEKKKEKTNFWYVFVLLLFFASGVLNLFEDKLAFVYVIIINALAYTTLAVFTIKHIIALKLKIFNRFNLFYILFTVLFLLCLVYLLFFIVFDKNYQLYGFVILYVITLFSLTFFNTLLSSLNYNQANSYLMIAIFCYLICDIFYVLYYYYLDFLFFRYVSVLCNVMSFYFLVHYFLSDKKQVESIE